VILSNQSVGLVEELKKTEKLIKLKKIVKKTPIKSIKIFKKIN